MNAATLPWYKQRWPWLLIMGPAIAVVACVVTFWLAIVSNDGLVADDYYKRGKEIHLDLSRDQAALQQGISGQLLTSREQPTSFRLLLTSKEPISGEISLKLLHPLKESFDQTVQLQAVGGGMFEGKLSQPLPAAPHWIVSIEHNKPDWRIRGNWVPKESSAIVLAPVSGNN